MRQTSPTLFSGGASSAPQDAARTPRSGWVTAHCDGGARGNPGPAGYGAVLQDETGEVLAQLSEFLGVRTNNFAEYSGLLGVLQWVLDAGRTKLRVISDSELMVKQIQGKYKVNSPDLRPLWEEARRRIARLESFEISHALRHKNKAADQLANDAMDRGMGRGAAVREAAPPPSRSGSPPAPRPGAAAADVRSSAGLRADAPVRPQSRPQTSTLPAGTTHVPASQMLRGFTRGGAIHLLGGASLPDGIFVKVIPE